MSGNEQICSIEKGSQAGHLLKINKRADISSPLQGQDRNIICVAALSFNMKHFILLLCTALSFKHILSDWCNCTMTGAIPHPHQSLLWRYGLIPNMTSPALPPPFPPWSASMFYGYSDK